MLTPWGGLEIADAHVHFFSHSFFSALAQQSGSDHAAVISRLGWEAPAENPVDLGARWASDLDSHGVAQATLIASVPDDELSVAAAVESRPDRFFGYFMVNPCAPGAQASARAALDRGLHGICFFPAMHRYSMHDERVSSLLAIASSRPGAIAFVHCGVLSVGVRKRLGLSSPFDMQFSNPIDLHAAALAFPNLPFVVPHFGAGYFREALILADLCPNVHFDTSSGNSWMKYESLDLRAVFRRALEVPGPKRLLFGSDSSYFPRGWVAGVFHDQVAVLQELGLTAEDASLIFGGNLRRLLGKNR